jgi:NAD-dependent dihydropyrimidine dehydrogenase PreA subunit
MQQVRFDIDKESCTGCKTCFDSCFVDVFRWDNEEKRPIIAYPEDCVACCLCEDSCPAKCIEVKPLFPWPEHASY